MVPFSAGTRRSGPRRFISPPPITTTACGNRRTSTLIFEKDSIHAPEESAPASPHAVPVSRSQAGSKQQPEGLHGQGPGHEKM
jgi:hypothetical protein